MVIVELFNCFNNCEGFFSGVGLDCKTVGFFVKISKEIGKAWRKSLMRAKRASLTRPSPVSLSVFSLVSRPFV